MSVVHKTISVTRVKGYNPEVINLFSCSTQLSMKFQLLIKGKMVKNKDFSCFKTLICCIYPADKC